MKARILTQLVLLSATGSMCYAQLTLIPNGGFESKPDFNNWTITGGGDDNIWTSANATFLVPEGKNMAEMSTDGGSGAVLASTFETSFLNLSAGTLSAQGGGGSVQDASGIKQTFTVTAAQAGQYLSLQWNLLADSADPHGLHPTERDYAFVTVNGAFVGKLGDIQSPLMHNDNPNNVFRSETGFQNIPFTFQFTTAGTYTLGIGIVDVNDQTGSDLVTSALVVDAIGLSTVPEPGQWGAVAAGALAVFCSIRRLRSRPLSSHG